MRSGKHGHGILGHVAWPAGGNQGNNDPTRQPQRQRHMTTTLFFAFQLCVAPLKWPRMAGLAQRTDNEEDNGHDVD